MVIHNFNFKEKPIEWFLNAHPIYNALVLFFDQTQPETIPKAFNHAYEMLLNIRERYYKSSDDFYWDHYSKERSELDRATWIILIILIRYTLRLSNDVDFADFLKICPSMRDLEHYAKQFEDCDLYDIDWKETLIITFDNPRHPSSYTKKEWYEITNDFSSDNIEYIVKTYSTKEEKIIAIETMEKLFLDRNPYIF